VKSPDDVLSRASRFKRSILCSMTSERSQMPAKTAFQIRLSERNTDDFFSSSASCASFMLQNAAHDRTRW
jgi:hypothetical protein